METSSRSAWTSLPGAQGYDLSVGNTPGSGNITQLRFPASAGTSFSIPAPTGTYYLRVRGFLGPIEGPFSNEEAVHPGLEPCVPGTTTTVTATPDGINANVAWTPVPGVSAYRVQWSRFSGITELEETVATNSVTRAMPFNGNFFVRVVAVSACGDTLSNEAPFTIAVTRRFLSPGEIASNLFAVQREFPRAFQLAHTGSGERYDFIILACRRLYQVSGGTVACNFRRALIGDLSMDGLSVQNQNDGRWYFADVISGAGGSNPILYYDNHPFHRGALLEDPSGRYAPHGAANPFGVPGSYGPIRTARNYGPAGGW